jgi:hypothetical protein
MALILLFGYIHFNNADAAKVEQGFFNNPVPFWVHQAETITRSTLALA